MARIENYMLYGNGLKAFQCKDDEVLLHGGVNTGKTLANFYRAHLFAQKYPGCRILFVRKALADLIRNAVATYEEVILPCDLGEASCPVALKHNKEGAAWYQYKENRSKIFLGGMNKKGSVLSGEYDLIVTVQTEEFEEEDWEYLLTRIGRGAGDNAPYAMLTGDANPHVLGRMHWLMRREGLTRFKLLREHNPALRDQKTGELTKLGEDTERRLDRLTGVTRKRLRDGEWVGSDRLVYPEFSDNTHVIDKEDAEELDIMFEKWYMGMDWGYEDAASLSLYGLTYGTELFPEPRLIQVRQTYRKGELISFWKKRAVAYQRWVRRYFDGYIQKMICDKSRPEFIEEMRLSGLPAVKTDGGAGSIRENINAVKTRLDNNTLLFFRDNLDDRDEILEAEYKPLNTLDEITRYENPKPKTGARKLPDPIGENHGLDELGYVSRDLHIVLTGTDAEIETYSGSDVINTRLSLEKSKPPPRWQRQIGLAEDSAVGELDSAFSIEF